jgi:hypothetical protein
MGSRPTLSWSTERCQLAAEVVSPEVLLIRVSGHFHVESVQQFIRFCDREVKSKVVFFVDFWDLEDYETETRRLATEWTNQWTTEVHLLVRSTLVKMGVAVANMLLGGRIRTHNRRFTFDQLVWEARHRSDGK